MPAGTPPAVMAPTSMRTHSGRLKPRIQTFSSGARPSAMSARATVSTSSA